MKRNVKAIVYFVCVNASHRIVLDIWTRSYEAQQTVLSYTNEQTQEIEHAYFLAQDRSRIFFDDLVITHQKLFEICCFIYICKI